MIKQLYENLKTAENPRKDLISIKQELKEEVAVEQLKMILQKKYDVFLDCLKHEDAKVRKNAALILGVLKAEETRSALYEAYKEETQRFVKSDYLTALENLNYQEYMSELEQRLKELEEYQPEKNEEKHIREEMTALRKLVSAKKAHKRHSFIGYGESYEMILTTEKKQQEVTDRKSVV